MDECVQRLLAHKAKGDHMVPKSPALTGLAMQRHMHLLIGDQLGPDQKMSKLHSDGDDVLLNNLSANVRPPSFSIT